MQSRSFFLESERVRGNAINEIKGLDLGKYQVEIKPLKRSLAQNNLYWAWITEIAKAQGQSKEETHDDIKAYLLGTYERKTQFGDYLMYPKSSAELSKEEFRQYMDKVAAVADIMAVILPDARYFGGLDD